MWVQEKSSNEKKLFRTQIWIELYELISERCGFASAYAAEYFL